MKTRLLALMISAAISGCTVFPEKQPVQLLDLQLSSPAIASARVAQSLTVLRPVADPVRYSNRVLVRTRDGQLQVHPTARWVADAPELLRTLLVRYLRDGQTHQQISLDTVGLDQALALDVRQFELVENASNQLQVSVKLEARLYNNHSATLLQRHIFSHQHAIAGTEPSQIIRGFETALADIIPAIASWLLHDEQHVTEAAAGNHIQ